MSISSKKIQGNLDYQEVDKFNSLAKYWWDKDGDFKSLHRINPLRLEFIMRHSNGLFGKKVLDIGCGGGILSESMANEQAEVTGLDTSEESIKIARAHASSNTSADINYLHSTVEAHTNDFSNYYDVVTCMEVLEHLPDPRSVVSACEKLVKPGGEVFFSTINRSLKSWFMAVFGAEYILRLLPRGTHDAKKFIKPSELMAWLDETSIFERNIIGLRYNLITGKFSLGKSVDVNYMLHARKSI